jgi:hypothetical protein
MCIMEKIFTGETVHSEVGSLYRVSIVTNPALPQRMTYHPQGDSPAPNAPTSALPVVLLPLSLLPPLYLFPDTHFHIFQPCFRRCTPSCAARLLRLSPARRGKAEPPSAPDIDLAQGNANKKPRVSPDIGNGKERLS